MKVLHIDSSILGQGSVSRTLSAEVVMAIRAHHPGIEVTYRDLAADPIGHLSGTHLAALRGGGAAVERDIAAGEAALDEFLAADVVVVGAPMYNFTIPSQLKAWIDRIAVAGKTFRCTANGPEGLARGKKLIVASSRGGFFTGHTRGRARSSGKLSARFVRLSGHHGHHLRPRRGRGCKSQRPRAGHRTAKLEVAKLAA